MTVSNTAPLRVAMIGGGGMTREHIRAFQNVPGVTVVGIWNRTRDKAEALTGVSLRMCPVCHHGQMIVIELVRPTRMAALVPDTS